MKPLIGLLFASLALGGVLALPAGFPRDDAEVIDVPRRRVATGSDEEKAGLDPNFKNFKGVIDTGVGYPFLQPNPIPFSFNLGFFDSFEDIFRRLRTRLWPVELAGERSGDGDFSGEGPGLPFDPKKGNTTSTVKVVDGHKIEVNETVYGDGENVFRVRVVNIRPVDSDEDVAEADNSNVHGNGANPSTSAPDGNDNHNADDSDERREPLERKPDDNEIRGNIDDPEYTTLQQQFDTMLQTTTTATITTNEHNAANLNAAFVTDNSLEEVQPGETEDDVETDIGPGVAAGIGGDIEAETNKSVGTGNDNDNSSSQSRHNSSNESNSMNNYGGAGPAVEDAMSANAVSSRVEGERLTIGNNEETEVNDNLNESSHADAEPVGFEVGAVAVAEPEVEAASELATEVGELELKARTVADGDLRVKLGKLAAKSEFADFTRTETAGDEYDGNEDVYNADKKQAFYATNKNREDISSSDEESERDDVAEMDPAFKSEWANLADDLAKTDDSDIGLTNEIDAYNALPVDLSNDIAVNEVAEANPNYPLNPDAEFVDVEGIRHNGAMPKFEKMSLSAAVSSTTK